MSGTESSSFFASHRNILSPKAYKGIIEGCCLADCMSFGSDYKPEFVARFSGIFTSEGDRKILLARKRSVFPLVAILTLSEIYCARPAPQRTAQERVKFRSSKSHRSELTPATTRNVRSWRLPSLSPPPPRLIISQSCPRPHNPPQHSHRCPVLQRDVIVQGIERPRHPLPG